MGICPGPRGHPPCGSSVPWAMWREGAPVALAGSDTQTRGGPRELAAGPSRRNPLWRPHSPGPSSRWARLPLNSQGLHQPPAGPLGTLRCSRNGYLLSLGWEGLVHRPQLGEYRDPHPDAVWPQARPPTHCRDASGPCLSVDGPLSVAFPTIAPSGKCSDNPSDPHISRLPHGWPWGAFFTSRPPQPHAALWAASLRLPFISKHRL